MKYIPQITFFLLYLINATYSQGTYSVKIERSNTHGYVDNKAKKDTVEGTIQIPKMNSLEDVKLVSNKGVFNIPNWIWREEIMAENPKLSYSRFKQDNLLHILNDKLITESIFYGDEYNLNSDIFENTIAINTTNKVVIFGVEEKKWNGYSCYSMEIDKTGNLITHISINFNRVENTSAFERNISEYWELTRIDKDDNIR